MRRVSFKEYQILKMIYKNVVVISASDDEALIFIRKQLSRYRNNVQTIKERVNGENYVKLLRLQISKGYDRS